MSETAVTPTATGSFAKTPFAHVLVYLHTRELSGTLEVHQGDEVHHAYFQKGCPAKVRNSTSVEPLGKVLLDMGLIDGAAFQASLQALAEGRGLQGQILMGMGAITMPTLIRGLTTQATVLLVEHDMDIVLGISDAVTVMTQGSIIATGSPAEVSRNPRVQSAYLGTARGHP